MSSKISTVEFEIEWTKWLWIDLYCWFQLDIRHLSIWLASLFVQSGTYTCNMLLCLTAFTSLIQLPTAYVIFNKQNEISQYFLWILCYIKSQRKLTIVLIIIVFQAGLGYKCYLFMTNSNYRLNHFAWVLCVSQFVCMYTFIYLFMTYPFCFYRRELTLILRIPKRCTWQY